MRLFGIYALLCLAASLSLCAAELDRLVGGRMAKTHNTPKECIHTVPNGAQLAFIDQNLLAVTTDNSTYTIKLCPPVTAASDVNATPLNGYFQDAVSIDNSGYSFLYANWSVPRAPSTFQNRDLNYLFPGLVPADDSSILQPVLQYGPSPIGGGTYWAVASWWVPRSGNLIASSLTKVNEGDRISGYIWKQDGKWYVRTDVNGGYQSSISIPESSVPIQPYAYIAMEVYLADCPDLAASAIEFTDIKAGAALNWAVQSVSSCGGSVQINANDRITIQP